ncbi:DNA translocase FtsK [Amycolatopsis keratiniphila]|uniref:Cell division FtsK/SpoIIIE n=1 Tax=Amycolatopsis keratiniphila TaxID=129921 RepID=W6HWE5_9PSEU|nr:DNA translocase FtsK [Amycolatopsis keratiniphila]AHJ58550.1 cell division FtsK/SpoIIIE [Amycolatopsis keratiniphila]
MSTPQEHSMDEQNVVYLPSAGRTVPVSNPTGSRPAHPVGTAQTSLDVVDEPMEAELVPMEDNAEIDARLRGQRLLQFRQSSAQQAIALSHRAADRLPNRQVRRVVAKRAARAVGMSVRNAATDPFLGVKILVNRYLDWLMVAHLREDGRRDKGPQAHHHETIQQATKRTALISLAGATVAGGTVAGDLLIYPDANPVIWSGAAAIGFGCWLRGHVTRRREARIAAAKRGEFRTPSTSGVPDEITLTGAYQAAGILRSPTTNNAGEVTKPGQALRLVEKTFSGDRWKAVVEFPAGISAAQVRKKHAEIASALGASVDTVFLSLVRGHAGRLAMTVFAEDPFDGHPVASPLVHKAAGTLSPYEHNRLGATPTGEDVTLSLFQGNLLVASMPGYGKTSVIRVALTPAVLDPYTRLVVFDGKPDNADNTPYAQIAETFRQGDDDEIALELLHLLRKLFLEGQRRFGKIRRLGEDKLNRRIHENTADPDLALTCVFIDEVHLFTANRQPGPWSGADGRDATVGQLITEEIVRIIKTPGRAGGIPMILATQDVNESTGGLPRAITKVMNSRIGLYLDGPQESNSILGQGKASQGWDCSADSMMRQGIGILRRGMPQPGEAPLLKAKWDYISAAQAADIAERGRAERQRLGLLRGEALAWVPENELVVPDVDEDDVQAQQAEVEAALPELGENATAVAAQAVELIVTSQYGSPAMLQRKLRIGWHDAQQLMDHLAQHDIVGPVTNADGQRDVLVAADRLDEALLRLASVPAHAPAAPAALPPVLAEVHQYVTGDDRDLVPSQELYDQALSEQTRANVTMTAFGREMTKLGIAKDTGPGRGSPVGRRVADIHAAAERITNGGSVYPETVEK